MKTKKRLSMLLVIVMILSLLPTTVFAATSVHLKLNDYAGTVYNNPANGGYCGYLLIDWRLILEANPTAVYEDFTNLCPLDPVAGKPNHGLGTLFIERLWDNVLNGPDIHYPMEYRTDLFLLPMTTAGNNATSQDAGTDITYAIFGAILCLNNSGNLSYGYFPMHQYAPAGNQGIVPGVEASGTLNASIDGVPLDVFGAAELLNIKNSVPVPNSEVNPGNTITYTITTKNMEIPTGIPAMDNSLIAKNIVATDTIPAGTTYVPGSITLDGAPLSDAIAFNATSKVITWPLGDINPQQTKTMTFQVIVNQLPAGQNTGSIRNFAIVDKNETNPVDHSVKRLGSIQVIKLDADSPAAQLAGAHFSLTYLPAGAPPQVVNSDLVTDASGQIGLSNLAYGNYVLEETIVPAGYILPAGEAAKVYFTLSSSDPTTYVIRFQNARQSYPIRVYKYDAITHLPLAGVIFELFDGNGAGATRLAELPATNASGYAQTPGIYKPGTYYVKEKFVPGGYILDPNYHPVTVNVAQTNGMATIEIGNQQQHYPIGVYKVDDVNGAPLLGVIFELFDGNGAGATRLAELPATNASGYAQTTGTYAPGTYYLKEKSTINGYVLDSGYHAVTVGIGQAGGVATITVRNARTKYPIGVYKVDDVNGAPLSGVIFELFDGNGAGATRLAELPATNASGYAQTTGTYAPGTYYLKEKSTINGYVLDSSYHAVTVGIGQAGGVATITVRNARTKYPIGVYKVDDVNGAPLSGVIFELFDGNGAGATRLAELPATNASGYAQTTGTYAPGTYYLKEKSTISGYVLDSSYHAVTVGIGQAGGVATITVRNARVGYPIEILKLDDVSGAPLADVVFRVYQEVLSIKVPVTGDLTTNASGIATSGALAPGNYFVHEISVPNGYELDPDYHPVTVNIGQAGGKAQITVRDNRTKYPIGVYKVDDVNGAPLSGVIFELFDGNGAGATRLAELPATNASGYAQTTGTYAPGTYYLKEKSTINGYVLDSGYHAVTVGIGQAGGVATITVRNARTPYRIQIIKLDQRDEETPLQGAVFELHAAVASNSIALAALQVGGLLETLTTDVNGQAITQNTYAPGQYFLVETSAPIGFHPITEPILVTLDIGAEPEDGILTIRILDNFINEPSIIVEKRVANITRSFPPAELTELYVGETAQYSVTVTNNGNAPLTNVTLTDNQAIAGTSVTTSEGGTLIWQSGAGGIATLNLGDLAVGESLDLIYNYITTDDDLAIEPITNTVVATGQLQPTPDYPEGTQISDDDAAIITITDIPLNQAGITLTKLVQNLTQGGVPAELSGGYPGDVFRYTIKITNTGSLDLTSVQIFDDRVRVGGTIKNVTKNTTLTWLSDEGTPYLPIADLVPGESVTFTYEYTSTAADISSIRVNTAKVLATVAITLDDPNRIVIEAEDAAQVAVDEIPITGESGETGLIGLTLLLGAAALVLFRKRREDKDLEDFNVDD